MKLEKFSMGTGDRFGRQGRAQLAAVQKAQAQGLEIVPVWNKSHREHTIIGTAPMDVRNEADLAVQADNWQGNYYVDADHIGLKNVNLFLEASDFFTIDVADFIGKTPYEDAVRAFVETQQKYVGDLRIPGIAESFEITRDQIEAIARKFLLAVQEAGKIYRHIETAKGKDNFITEVSMDESDEPQTPVEMFFILAALADEGIPVQTIAPKFTGRFNKGVDYVGDVAQFTQEFDADLAVIRLAVQEFGLPENLKLSVHSGSDKFSIYAPIHQAIGKYDAGLHLKTAGTTWLEELIGLASAGGEGLQIARQVYRKARGRYDELCGPYATVIDIDQNKLPSPDEVDKWSGEQFAVTLRHDLSSPHYNLHFRQLLHVGYKIAAEMGSQYLDALEEHEAAIAPQVTENIYERHIKPVFIG
jgi:tagaturonate epimerase